MINLNLKLSGEELKKKLNIKDGEKGLDGVNGSPDSGEQIVDKINELPTDDNDLKIDAKHIKNLPKAGSTSFFGGSGIKEIIAGTNITVDNSKLGYPKVSATGGVTPSTSTITRSAGLVTRIDYADGSYIAYTYNSDEDVATATDGTYTKTYNYSAGLLTGITVV